MAYSPDYSAALHGLAYQIIENGGWLRLEGRDQVAFLQRQTTNDLRLLKPGLAQLSVLTSPTARILDVLYLFFDESGALDALTLPGRGPITLAFLRRRIFFSDQVRLGTMNPGWLHVRLLGPQAADMAPALTAALGLERLPAPGEISRGAIAGGAIAGGALLVLPGAGPFGPGWRLLAAPAAHEAVLSALHSAGGVALEPHTAEILRVEAGIPGPDGELTEAYTPLEMLLEEAISGSKGCYTGQEIIARQLTYDKVTQRLCRLRLSQPAQPGETVSAEGRPCGKITSAALSPRFGPIALAVLRRPYCEEGVMVEVNGSSTTVTERFLE